MKKTYTNHQNPGLSLIKKGQKGVIHAIFSRFGLILLMLVMQFFILFSIFQWFENFLPHILGSTVIFTIIMVIYLLNNRINCSLPRKTQKNDKQNTKTPL